ncbi:coiled-coil domain-containing protein 192 [Vombatus ursinus]|uniref:coiled-coil domain-containing protein 192 n=1 Tax=Vombatus ursinus TaxID=29139 RepID=UPI000FFD0418|nr:coiled-coil domain-containing protein 192 [Vombatus ursinus]
MCNTCGPPTSMKAVQGVGSSGPSLAAQDRVLQTSETLVLIYLSLGTMRSVGHCCCNSLGLQRTEALESGQMACALTHMEDLEMCLKEAEEKAKTLTERLAVSEGTKSKLLEQVSWLEEQLEAADNREARGEPYEEIMHAKNQCIEKLQAEVKASQEQLAAHKLKHKRKMKKLQTDLATAKQEAAITVLELGEKLKSLYEGKPTPRDGWQAWKMSEAEENSLEESCRSLPPVEEGDRRISLIMELSTQVSLQTEKINQLEEVLEEREKKIQQLEAERESPMSKLKAFQNIY